MRETAEFVPQMPLHIAHVPALQFPEMEESSHPQSESVTHLQNIFYSLRDESKNIA